MRRNAPHRGGFARMIVPAFAASLICVGAGAFIFAPSNGSGETTGGGTAVEAIPTHDEIQVWDAGAVKRPVPNEVSHEFTVRNSTSAPIELKSFERSCSCTEFEPQFDSIPPGEVGRINAALSLVGPGPRSTTVTASWSDGTTSTFHLAARAVVPIEIKVSPRHLILGPDGTAEAVLTYICQSEEDAPGRPRIVSDDTDALSIDFPGWDLISEGDPERLVASRYQAMVKISHTGELNRSGAGFRIMAGETRSQPLMLALSEGRSPTRNADISETDG